MVVTQQGIIYAVIAGICVGVAEIMLFTVFAKGGDVAVAMPLVTAGSLVIVAVIGIMFLGEAITPVKIAGAVMAILGVALLAAG